ncbi:hypothetical protein KR100_09780 [Synechococcus sp. KORDI-100]|nr:hypothetical protein KR100_09780 [Synechococcus sp. KORDI-100]
MNPYKNSIISNSLCDVASFAYPEILELIEAQCLPIIDQILIGREFGRSDKIVTLLEFHHDGSDMIDISFFGKNWSEVFKKDIFPSWWGEIEDLCISYPELDNDPVGNPFMSIASKKDSSGDQASTNKSVLQLIDDQFVECEIRDDHPRTAGIFVKTTKKILDKEKPFFSSTFDVILVIQKIADNVLFENKAKAQAMINRLVDGLNDPVYIGIMVGRSHNLKLIFGNIESAANTKKILESECMFQGDFKYLSQLNAVVSDLVKIKDANIRPCLDIDLLTNTINPRVCFEVFPVKRFAETRNWKVLEKIALICDLNPQDIVHVRTTHQHLPIGKKTDPLAAMLIQKMSTQPQKRDNNRIDKRATLSHYKICIEPEKACKIKSYAYITQEFHA